MNLSLVICLIMLCGIAAADQAVPLNPAVGVLRPAVPDLQVPLRPNTPVVPDLQAPLRPNGPHQPLHPLPRVNAQMGLLLIDDEVTSTQYVTTLDSRGNRVMGADKQFIFGSPHPVGQVKPLVWYTHAKNTDVEALYKFNPAAAFAGITDLSGRAIMQGNSYIDVPPSGPVNPVFSAQAWSSFSAMPIGGIETISVTEMLNNGTERELRASVAKRAHLRLGRALERCQPMAIDGISGSVCSIRSVSGQNNATTAGDIRFTVRANAKSSGGRFRVGQQWHRLGEAISIAEFAQARSVDVFFPTKRIKLGAALQLDESLNASFFSQSRQGVGDRLVLRVESRQQQAKLSPVLGRADVLLIEDKPTGRQYVTTLRSSGTNAIFGERNGLSSKGAATWYTSSNGMASALNPLTRVSQLQPPEFFRGLANSSGERIDSVTRPAHEGGYINPVFSDEAFRALLVAPVGRQQRVALQAEYTSGAVAPYQLNVNKGGHISLGHPTNSNCYPTEVDGIAGNVCPLRQLTTNGAMTGDADIRFSVQAKLPYALQQQARYRVGQRWLNLQESLPVAELGNGSTLDLFVPNQASSTEGGIQLDSTVAVQADIYSQRRSVTGDRFTIVMPIPLAEDESPDSSTKSPDSSTISKSRTMSLIACNTSSLCNGLTGNCALYEIDETGSAVSGPAYIGDVFTPGTSGGAFRNEVFLDFQGYYVPDGAIPLVATVKKLNGATLNRTFEGATDDDGHYLGPIYPGFGHTATGDMKTQVQICMQIVNDRVYNKSIRFGQRVHVRRKSPNPSLPDTELFGDLAWAGAIVAPPSSPIVTLVSSPAVTASDYATFTVSLDKAAPAGGTQVYLKGIPGTANSGDFDGTSISSLSGAGGSVDFAQGGYVVVNPGATSFSFKVDTKDDSDASKETYEMSANVGASYDSASSKRGTLTINPAAVTPPIVASVSDTAVTAGEAATFTVSLDKAAPAGGTQVYLKGIPGTANSGDFDATSISSLSGASGSVDFAQGGYVVVNPGATSFSFKVDTKDDSDASIETYEMSANVGASYDSASSKRGTVTINPVPVTPPSVLDVSDTTVAAGELATVTVALNKPAPAGTIVHFHGFSDTANHNDFDGTTIRDLLGATGDVDFYDGGTVIVDPGASKFSFSVDTKDDTDIGVEVYKFSANVGSVSDTSKSRVGSITIEPDGGSPTELSVTSVSAPTVTAGELATVTVTLNKAAPAGTSVYLKGIDGTANASDFDGTNISSISAAGGSVDFATGGAVTVNPGATSFSFKVDTKDDSDASKETYEMSANVGMSYDSASAKKGTITIEPDGGGTPTDLIVTSVSSPTVTAGELATVTVTLNKTAPAGTTVYLKGISGTAGPNDFDSAFISDPTGTSSIVNFINGGTVAVEGVSSFSFKVDTRSDADTSSETYEMSANVGSSYDSASAKKGTITIEPDGGGSPTDLIVTSVSSPTVTAGELATVTVTLNKVPPARTFVHLKGINGTANSSDFDSNYTSEPMGTSNITNFVSGGAVAIEGVSEFSFKVDTRSDADTSSETYEMSANVGMSYDSASAKKGTITIEPPVLPPSIAFTSSPIPVKARFFSQGKPSVELDWGIRVNNVTRAAPVLAKKSDVKAYLQQRALSAYTVIARVEMPSTRVSGYDYCAFTNQASNLVAVPAKVGLQGGVAPLPLDCNQNASVNLGDPTSSAGWSHNVNEHKASLRLTFSMSDQVSMMDSSGQNWQGIASTAGSLLHISLQVP
ncbi:MAG: hypothetical protein ACRCVV_09060 [Shewanella sp.]